MCVRISCFAKLKMNFNSSLHKSFIFYTRYDETFLYKKKNNLISVATVFCSRWRHFFRIVSR